jgi:hypothetical protein
MISVLMRRVRDEAEPRATRRAVPARRPDESDQRTEGPAPLGALFESLQRGAGNAAVSRLLARDGRTPTAPASAHVVQRQAPGEEEEPAGAETAEKMPDFLNPEPLPEGAEAGPQTPKPGESGEAESVVYEITIMQPLRAALAAAETQDWDIALDQLKAIGFRLLDYQTAYEKSDPVLSTQLMAARGWLGIVYGQLNRRLNRDTWSDEQIADGMRRSADSFQEIESKVH